jgi:hypothetical protein
MPDATVVEVYPWRTLNPARRAATVSLTSQQTLVGVLDRIGRKHLIPAVLPGARRGQTPLDFRRAE